MTVCYQAYYKAYDEGKLIPSLRLGVKLVYQDYLPTDTDDLDYIPAIITVSKATTWDEISNHDMGWIIDNLKVKARAYISANPAKVEKWCENYPNREVLVQALRSEQFDLKDTGIKYLIVYCPSLGIPLFCEEL